MPAKIELPGAFRGRRPQEGNLEIARGKAGIPRGVLQEVVRVEDLLDLVIALADGNARRLLQQALHDALLRRGHLPQRDTDAIPIDDRRKVAPLSRVLHRIGQLQPREQLRREVFLEQIGEAHQLRVPASRTGTISGNRVDGAQRHAAVRVVRRNGAKAAWWASTRAGRSRRLLCQQQACASQQRYCGSSNGDSVHGASLSRRKTSSSPARIRAPKPHSPSQVFVSRADTKAGSGQEAEFPLLAKCQDAYLVAAND